MTISVQNQTRKKFGPFRPFFDSSAKNPAPDFPGPTDKTARLNKSGSQKGVKKNYENAF
jgi:hypothetical protein